MRPKTVQLLPAIPGHEPIDFQSFKSRLTQVSEAVPEGNRRRSRFCEENQQEPILEIQGLSKSFGGLRAVTDASLKFFPGDITGLIGQICCGKTTLFNMANGFMDPEDYIRAYYSLDSGSETFLTNGDQSDDFGSIIAYVDNLNGNTLAIIIRVNNNANNETHRFDNIKI